MHGEMPFSLFHSIPCACLYYTAVNKQLLFSCYSPFPFVLANLVDVRENKSRERVISFVSENHSECYICTSDLSFTA